MRKILYTYLMGVIIVASSCKGYLDINDNPNQPTSSTPDLVLPQAIVASAATSVVYNRYGGWVGGYHANAGGYGGFGSALTYTYTTTDNVDLWDSSYDNLNDYQYIINNTTTDGNDKLFNAVARIMKAFNTQRLVDQYGDVPYSEALQGLENLNPKYDKAEDIYTDLFTQLNTAIASINAADANTIKIDRGANGQIDVLFGGDVNKWKQFANTIKLRMLIRIQGVSALSGLSTSEWASLEENFITEDAIVRPGYAVETGKQNPMWNRYAITATNTNADLTIIPTTYAMNFYNGVKLDDLDRFSLVYRSEVNGQLGVVNPANPNSTGGSYWRITAGDNAGRGILKAGTMGQPLMLLAEAWFLQAEAQAKSLISGSAEDSFNEGIIASYLYLYKDASGTLLSGKTHDSVEGTELADYKAANTSYLVNYELADNPQKRLEAIITQKWLALNEITSDESWNEYRRTGYPTSTGTSANSSFASTQSTASTPDRLPVRVLYPSTEYSLNASNAPTGVSAFTSKLFWDVN